MSWNFGKFYAQTFTGSMMGKGSPVFAVWGYIIANKDRTGSVELNPAHLALLLGEPMETVQNAIEYLCSPDPQSRTQEHEGRRLLRKGQFTFHVVNAAKYGYVVDDEERREHDRKRKAAQRERERKGNGEAKPKPRPHKDAAIRLLAFLNEQTGKNFQTSDANLAMIEARLGEYDEEMLRGVIIDRVDEWGTDEAMKQYLRPATLFNKTKCAQYVGELPK